LVHVHYGHRRCNSVALHL